jgi:hypothetical protein
VTDDEEIDFPRGFEFGQYKVYGWTQHLTISREVQADGDEWCIVWIGMVDVVENESGGWMPEDGAAIGVRHDGSVAIDQHWAEHMAEGMEISRRPFSRQPLARVLWFAAHLAAAASGFLPAVDQAFERGDTFEQLIARVGVALDEALMRDYPDNPTLRENEVAVTHIALGLLWVSEEIRREQASAV